MIPITGKEKNQQSASMHSRDGERLWKLTLATEEDTSVRAKGETTWCELPYPILGPLIKSPLWPRLSTVICSRSSKSQNWFCCIVVFWPLMMSRFAGWSVENFKLELFGIAPPRRFKVATLIWLFIAECDLRSVKTGDVLHDWQLRSLLFSEHFLIRFDGERLFVDWDSKVGSCKLKFSFSSSWNNLKHSDLSNWSSRLVSVRDLSGRFSGEDETEFKSLIRAVRLSPLASFCSLVSEPSSIWISSGITDSWIKLLEVYPEPLLLLDWSGCSNSASTILFRSLWSYSKG